LWVDVASEPQRRLANNIDGMYKLQRETEIKRGFKSAVILVGSLFGCLRIVELTRKHILFLPNMIRTDRNRWNGIEDFSYFFNFKGVQNRLFGLELRITRDFFILGLFILVDVILHFFIFYSSHFFIFHSFKGEKLFFFYFFSVWSKLLYCKTSESDVTTKLDSIFSFKWDPWSNSQIFISWWASPSFFFFLHF
jgi:hypothetical protein